MSESVSLQRAVASGSRSLFPTLPHRLYLFSACCLISLCREIPCLSLKVLQRQRHYPKLSDQMTDWPVTGRGGTINIFFESLALLGPGRRTGLP